MADRFRNRSSRIAWLVALSFILTIVIPSAANCGEIVVAAASDLTFAFKEVASRFETETGNPVKLSYGSSGNFYSQIQNGAPYDIFFSADIEYPKRLERAGLIEPGTIYEYATGRIVLWAPSTSKLDLSLGLGAALLHWHSRPRWDHSCPADLVDGAMRRSLHVRA